MATQSCPCPTGQRWCLQQRLCSQESRADFTTRTEGLMRLFSAAVRCRLARGREEGICPQPAGRDSRLTSLPAAVAQASKEGASLAGGSSLPAAARGRCCSLLASASQELAVQRGACCPEQDTAPGMGVGGTNKVTITLFLLVLFFTTFLLLFVYFVISLLLSIFLILLGKTKHHLKKMHWGREKVEETFSTSACSHLSC